MSNAGASIYRSTDAGLTFDLVSNTNGGGAGFIDADPGSPYVYTIGTP